MKINSLTEHAGGITWWSLGQETDPMVLLHGIEKLGLPKYVPEPRSWLMSLKTALADLYPGHLIRPLKHREKNGYGVFSEVKQEHTNDFPMVCSASIDDDGHASYRSGDGSIADLQDKVNHFRLFLPGASVSAMLVEIATVELGGITMREGGGIYFIPHQSVGRWVDVCDVVEQSANQNTRNSMTVCPMEVNTMTLRDIRDAIIREIGTECAKIRQELVDNELGAIAVENRVTKSKTLFDRMTQYESLLGEALGECRKHMSGTLQALQAARSIQDDSDVFNDIYAEV